MASKDYTWLVGSIAGWLHRTDLTAVIPDFIVLAETKMGEDLKAHAMEATATLTIPALTAYVDLPADFRGLRSLKITSFYTSTPEYVSPPEMDAREIVSNARPERYTIIGTQLKFSPVPDVPLTVEIVYERLIPPLSATSLTNWLITRSPNAYLFGALAMAQPYIQKDDRIMFQNLYADAINGINVNDWDSAADMHVKTDARTA